MTPKLTKAERKRHIAGMTILRTVGNETSVIEQPLRTTHASNIPDRAAPTLDKYIKSIGKHELYGSLAMQSRTFHSRTPQDVDIVVNQPKKVALDVRRIMQKHGSKARIESNPQFNSHVVQVKKKGEWVDAVDIHPLQEHKVKFDVYGKSLPPRTIKGIKVQRAADQLLRKANAVMQYNEKEGRMGAPSHRREKDVIDFVITSRLLLDSKELKAQAELAQVKEARKALTIWRRHARDVRGRKGGVGRDPIPEYREQQFIKHARDNPSMNVDSISLNWKGARSARSARSAHSARSAPSAQRKKTKRSFGSRSMVKFGRGG